MFSLPNCDVLAFADKVSTQGTVAVATLDPMSHFGAYFMPAIERFLNGSVPRISEVYGKQFTT
ncbi:hypothetical protein B2J88_28025 [Rhodococcus sp. SRB_17]|nr:hypothetical protein [Rhodococcus sp. SRB_17]